jgi:hypothetical protein
VSSAQLAEVIKAQSASAAQQHAALSGLAVTAATHTAALSEQKSTLDKQTATLAEQQQLLAVQAAALEEQRTALAAQAAELADLHARIGSLDAAFATSTTRVEARLAEVSENLLRQLDELSREMEAAGDSAEQGGATVALLAELRDAQAKLAQEQVRYDLALRQELAELADRVRRGPRP